MNPTTADEQLQGGRPNDRGWVELARAAGAAHEGLSPEGEPIATIVHLSDLHICDAESPARQEYLDRHGHPGAPYRRMLGDIGTYRPQEVLTVPVAVAMVEAVNRLAGGPLTGRPVDACVLTGDLVDNAQANELDWYLSVVGGGYVLPTSGDPDSSGWVGATDSVWSPYVWHPEGHRSGRTDIWVDTFGFPYVEGFLEAARRPVRSPGLQVPAYGVHGNHDALLQGTVPADDALGALAVGGRRVIDLAPGQTPLVVLEAVPRTGPARYPHTPTSPTEPVVPDIRRRLLAPGELPSRLARFEGPRRLGGPGAAFTVPLTSEVRLVALDTVNPHGGWEGSIDRDQLSWLRDTLRAAPEPYLVVASHHPSWCLMNPWHPPGTEPRVLADEVLGTVLAERRVIMWLAGHVHHHAIVVHEQDDRRLPEITSASLIDWPQQSRVLEVVREDGGTLALVSTAIDHVPPMTPAVDDHSTLAALSRLLARNAPLIRDTLGRAEQVGRSGWWSPRNTILRVPDPAS